ncbi:MAG: sugar-transfer associated ATP-grasp domain-containing protein [Verrucomicrobiota bacterium]
MKELTLSLIRSTPMNPELTEKVLFFGKMGYWPNFDEPKTYNEKVNWRKLRSTNERFIQCTDKLAVRSYVREKIGEQYLIPLLHGGNMISPEELLAFGDDIVIKASHDSGSAVVIRENSIEKAREACEKIEESLSANYGERTNEWWYAEIPPKVCVEKLILNEKDEIASDFKFFVFRQQEGKSPEIFIEVDFDRNTGSHHRGFYNSNREQVDTFGKGIVIDDVPNHDMPFPEVANYHEMLEVVKKLASEFDHVRVDLYHAQGRIYFGELTFSEGGGRSKWSPPEFDELLGNCWNLDRSTGGAECPVRPEKKVEQLVARNDEAKRTYQSAKQKCCRLASALGVRFDRIVRFFALPYAVAKWVDWNECPRNPFLVYFDHLYIFFALRYFPDNYAACRLWEKPRSEWKNYYGRGYDPYAVERRNRVVRRADCSVLFEDKEVCHQLCQSWGFPLPRQVAVIDPSENLAERAARFLAESEATRYFVKPVDGDGGRGSCVIERVESGLTIRQISAPDQPLPLEAFSLSSRSVVQEEVVQHADIDRLFAGSLNTVRIATLYTPERDVRVIGAFLRVGKGSQFVDNGDQGGIGAKIDLKTGRLAKTASNNRGKRFDCHPDTNVKFGSVVLPFWKDLLALAREVQFRFSPFNRFLGMDIGFSESGPVLIEVNDIFDSGRFESVVGPILQDPEILRICREYELITHGRHH